MEKKSSLVRIVSHVDVKQDMCNATKILNVVHYAKWQAIRQCNMDKNSLMMNANVCVFVTKERFHVMVTVNPGLAEKRKYPYLTVTH